MKGYKAGMKKPAKSSRKVSTKKKTGKAVKTKPMKY